MIRKDIIGHILWRSEIGHTLLVAPALTDKLVIVVGLEQSSHGRIGFLDALDRDTGQKRWCFNGSTGMGLRGGILGTPVVCEELLYFGDGCGVARSLDIRTGLQRWESELNAPITVSPIIAGDKVLFADDGGSLTAFEPNTGQCKWTFRAEEAIRTRPVFDNEHIIFSSWDGFIYAVNTEGSPVWKVDLSPIRTVSMNIAAGHIFLFDSASGDLRTLEIKKNSDSWQIKERWRLGMGHQSGIQLVCEDRLLYVVDKERHRIDCLDAISGTLRWTTITESSPLLPIVIFEQLIVVCRNGEISAFDPNKGSLKWQIETGILLSSDPYIHRNVLYVGGSDGAISAFVLKI